MRSVERRNEALSDGERWQPPAYVVGHSAVGRAKAAARRLLDLQAASIWRDLRDPLGRAKGTVLDVGAGAQPYRALVSSEAVYQAIDTALAGENFGYEVPDTEYFTGEVWPVANGSIDLVLATEALEHVPDTHMFLTESRRVLRAGGTLIITVPFAARWHYVPHDYWRFTPSGLKLVLERAGYTNIVVHARGNEVTVAAAKVMALMLPLLMPQGSNRALVRRLAGVALSPLLLLLGAIGQASLRRHGGEDCLGYTVYADPDAGWHEPVGPTSS